MYHIRYLNHICPGKSIIMTKWKCQKVYSGLPNIHIKAAVFPGNSNYNTKKKTNPQFGLIFFGLNGEILFERRCFMRFSYYYVIGTFCLKSCLVCEFCKTFLKRTVRTLRKCLKLGVQITVETMHKRFMAMKTESSCDYSFEFAKQER